MIMPATAIKNFAKEIQVRCIFCHSVGWRFDPVVPGAGFDTRLFVIVEDAFEDALGGMLWSELPEALPLTDEVCVEVAVPGGEKPGDDELVEGIEYN